MTKNTECKNPTNGEMMLLSKCPICNRYHQWVIFCSKCRKMNYIIKKFVLTGDTFMHEMHLRQPEFTYSLIYPQGRSHKTKQGCKNSKQQETPDISTRNDLNTAFFVLFHFYERISYVDKLYAIFDSIVQNVVVNDPLLVSYLSRVIFLT